MEQCSERIQMNVTKKFVGNIGKRVIDCDKERVRARFMFAIRQGKSTAEATEFANAGAQPKKLEAPSVETAKKIADALAKSESGALDHVSAPAPPALPAAQPAPPAPPADTIDSLRVAYRERVGKDADKRWSLETLKKKLKAFK
jgi:hypothetical protein